MKNKTDSKVISIYVPIPKRRRKTKHVSKNEFLFMLENYAESQNEVVLFGEEKVARLDITVQLSPLCEDPAKSVQKKNGD